MPQSERISLIEKYKQRLNSNKDNNSIPFEMQIPIPKEGNRIYRAVYSKRYGEIALKLDIAGGSDLDTWTNIQIV